MAQLALTLTEQTLFAATEAIKYAGLENKDVVKPVVENIEAIRRSARAIRRAGISNYSIDVSWHTQDLYVTRRSQRS